MLVMPPWLKKSMDIIWTKVSDNVYTCNVDIQLLCYLFKTIMLPVYVVLPIVTPTDAF